MDAQEMHDYKMSQRKLKLDVGSKKKLEKALRQKNGASMEPPRGVSDPIAAAGRNHPGLTPERAAEWAERFGF